MGANALLCSTTIVSASFLPPRTNCFSPSAAGRSPFDVLTSMKFRSKIRYPRLSRHPRNYVRQLLLSSRRRFLPGKVIVPDPLKGTLETILVVDDHEIVRKTVVSILEHSNFVVLSAGCGASAVKLAQETERTIDLLHSGVNMPEMSGPELGVHRRKVREAIGSALPRPRKKTERPRWKMKAAVEFVDAVLEADRKAPRKQLYMHLRKTALGILVPETCVPQSYGWGVAAQVD